MREKFCMRCGTPLNGAAQCPECGYEPQHGEYEVPGGATPTGQSAPQADNAAVPAPGAAMPPAGAPAVPRRLLQARGLPLAPRPARRHRGVARSPAAPRRAGCALHAACRAGGQPLYGVPPYAASGACGAQGGGYAPPYAAWQPRPEPLTLGRTIGTLLAGAVPLIGWIVLLIWAFESGAEPNRRTLARGCLVVKAIGLALVVLLYALLFVFMFSMAGAML